MPYFQNALASTMHFVIGLYLVAVILRFLFQSLRVDFRNPFAQLVITITNPPLKMLRRFVPGLYGIDLSAVLLILLVGLLKLAVPLLIAGYSFRWSGAVVLALADCLDIVAWVFLIAVLARVVISWVAPRSSHPAIHIIFDVSQPLLAPFQRIVPSFAGLDFSPIAALFAIRLAQQLLLSPLADFGARLL